MLSSTSLLFVGREWTRAGKQHDLFVLGYHSATELLVVAKREGQYHPGVVSSSSSDLATILDCVIITVGGWGKLLLSSLGESVISNHHALL